MDDFDRWNDVKKKINTLLDNPDRFPKEGEVWMSSFGKNVGFEENGAGDNFSRPILIVKKFNNRMFWAIPLSTKQKNLSFYYNYTDPNGLAASAIIAQLRLVSIKRLDRNMYELQKDHFFKIKEKIKSLIK
jgi:mRNA interferase MazF